MQHLSASDQPKFPSDLKPENVLLDDGGNIRLTDFGCAKENVTSATSGASTFCGTPEYIPPEIVLRKVHGRAVDWWALGALIYEMLTGLPPFYSRSRDEMFEKIVSASMLFPRFISTDTRDFLSKLLHRDASSRLGSGDSDGQEIKDHPYFSVTFVSCYYGFYLPCREWIGMLCTKV